MPMLKILVLAVGMTLGSLLVAIVLSWLAWWVATRMHHPRWGPVFLFLVLGGVWSTALGHSEFVKMASVFGVAAAGLLCLIGREQKGSGTASYTKMDGSYISGRKP